MFKVGDAVMLRGKTIDGGSTGVVCEVYDDEDPEASVVRVAWNNGLQYSYRPHRLVLLNDVIVAHQFLKIC